MSTTTNAGSAKGSKDASPFGPVGKALNELDDRLGVAKGGRSLFDKIFPDHWSFMLGEIALYSFVILLVTGVFLTFYYVPSQQLVVFPRGVYAPLAGQHVSAAFASSVEISFKVSERKYGAWPSHIRSAFEAARTVRVGKPTFKLNLTTEAVR